jgi:hypothetical protein
MRESGEALKAPLSEYDPRLELRIGNQESLARAQKELLEALELVSTLSETTAESVQIISEKVTRFG